MYLQLSIDCGQDVELREKERNRQECCSCSDEPKFQGCGALPREPGTSSGPARHTFSSTTDFPEEDSRKELEAQRRIPGRRTPEGAQLKDEFPEHNSGRSTQPNETMTEPEVPAWARSLVVTLEKMRNG